jgi:UPF0755 protein
VKTIIRLFVVGLILAVAAFGWLWSRLAQPYKGFTGEVFLDFPMKTRTSDMANALARKGVVEKPWMFLAARALSPHSRLQAGEYKFDKPASAFDVFARIARGDIYYQVLTVPEGHNIFDIEDDLKPLGLFPPGAFLKAARDPELIRDLDPSAHSLEGYLFPDSYHLNKRSTVASLLRTMTARFREQWQELAAPGSTPGYKGSVHDAVTLASMVEREAKLPEERPLIAGVFANRLKIGMRLDCDPTTVYAALLENRYRGKIYRSDLDNPNAYNTYQHGGLPPGPIANPGSSSLRAALDPAHTKYLYFVAKADGSGGHHFSDDLSGHLAATALLRAAERK